MRIIVQIIVLLTINHKTIKKQCVYSKSILTNTYLILTDLAELRSLLSGENWLQATSCKLQALIDAFFRFTAINGITEGGII